MIKQCEECGKEFEGSKYNRNPRFCSHSCQLKYTHSIIRGSKRHPPTQETINKIKESWKQRRLNGLISGKIVPCLSCKKIMYVYPYRLETQKFCSYNCLKEYKSNKTYEEIYGVEKARLMKMKQSKKRKIICNTKEGKEKLKYANSFSITPIKDTSIEVKIQNFLKQLGIEFITHFYISEIKNRYRCDIFVPSMNLIIECDGNYFHGNPEFYSEEELNLNQKEQKERDKLRTQQLVEKGYKVVRLWEKEIRLMELNEFKYKLENVK